MPRFFVSPEDISDGFITLNARDAEHIRVLRVRPDETITVCDGQGSDYVCKISTLERDFARAEIISSSRSIGEPGIAVTAYLAYAKGDRLEYAVQKLVELGVRAIVLFPSERIIAKPTGDGKKLARLATIALDAAKQSGRGIVPAVTAADTFESAIRAAACAELPIFFYENERENALYDVLQSRGGVKTVSIVTGAEGGFTSDEAAFAASCGLVSASLGTRILRCDTAPIAAIAVITAVITAINN